MIKKLELPCNVIILYPYYQGEREEKVHLYYLTYLSTELATVRTLICSILDNCRR